PGADDVDADDVGKDALWRHEARHRLLVGHVAVDEMSGDATGAQDLAAPVDVDQKGVERPRALLDAAFEPTPFALREDPGEHVEGDEPVGIAALAIDGKGDADAAEERLCLRLLHLPQFRRHGAGPVLK